MKIMMRIGKRDMKLLLMTTTASLRLKRGWDFKK
ncbi:uncharacterized protein METZ01_LOCUS261484 [marine metagenome]|uniref:Uncharacterized protein n=1 Tax=marine metagenome TaxID=408172 RepID=A0A382J966_9ZZZZ